MIHYNPHKWSHHLWDIRGSMVREIVYRVVFCVAWAAAVVAIHRHARPVEIPSTAHALVGTALGLLLVFRTNSSYDRFWEGRRLWGSIVNDSRSLVRLARSLLADRPDLLLALTRLAIAFPYATKKHLRGHRGLGPVERYGLPAEEAEAILRSPHPPLDITARATDVLDAARRAGVVTEIAFTALDDHLRALVAHLGACERIRSTPMPFAYAVHLRRSLLFYTLTLPFALVGAFGWNTVTVTFLIAYIMFGVEEIGVEIEDPFGVDDNDLPLDDICANIERHLLALLPAPGQGGQGSETARRNAATQQERSPDHADR